MKKLFVIILIAMVSVPAFSQIKFGLKAGLNTTSLSMDDLETVKSGSTEYAISAVKEAKYGFHGGAFMRLTLLGIYVQPELLFSTRTNEYTVTNVSSTVSTAVKQNFNKLDIPVMVGFKLGPIRLNAGPAASLLINSPKDLVKDSDFKSNYNKMTIGYQAGLGFDLLKTLTFDVRYEGSLKKYQNQIENVTGTKFNMDDRPNAFLFSVGLMF
ncbi:MAG TPA: porin family protein [Bacteroidales bacterium]|nr:porin family protein [Bacteroidales bacterium]HPT20767.1 porin family protein [Bacteroidales bacterium]